MSIKRTYTYDNCDELGPLWSQLSEKDRIDKIIQTILRNSLQEVVEVTRALPTGFVYVKLLQDMSPGERGTFLLDFEQKLKVEIDVGLSVWCDPLGDRNSLRNLRGVQISKGEQGED